MTKCISSLPLRPVTGSGIRKISSKKEKSTVIHARIVDEVLKIIKLVEIDGAIFKIHQNFELAIFPLEYSVPKVM